MKQAIRPRPFRPSDGNPTRTVRRSNNRVNVEPLAPKAARPTTESAIKVHGDEAGSARITFDLYPEDLDQLKDLFTIRGCELVLVTQEA